MSWSVGESGALALKAARGAGMSWGQAEEASFAVRWLQQRGAPGVEALANYLASYGTEAAAACPLAIGTALSDTAITPPTEIGMVHQPMLLIPFVASIATNGPVRLSINDTFIDVFPDHFITLDTLADITVATGTVAITDSPITAFRAPADGSSPRVPDTTEPAMANLANLAANTYAPATEESRAGAGSGMSDND